MSTAIVLPMPPRIRSRSAQIDGAAVTCIGTLHDAMGEAYRLFGRYGDNLRHQYLRYWQKYAYFYAIYPYREYIRFGRYHRNPVSCLVRDILAEEYGEHIVP